MDTKKQTLGMMGQGEAAAADQGQGKKGRNRARVDVTEHRATGRVYQSEPPAADTGTKETRRAERAATKATRRARRGSESFDRAASGGPLYLESARVYGPPQRADLGAHLASLADAAGRAYARRREAMDGRTIPADQVEELANIYHVEFARAVMRAGVCPASRAALYIPRSNPLPFRALRAWIAATREAGKKCRSYLWGHGSERRDNVSIHDPATPSALADLAAYWSQHGPGEAATAPDTATDAEKEAATATGAGDGATERCRTSPALRAHVRQHIRHYSDCLRVFWTMSGSRKSAAGLREDLRLLATAARIARAGGVERLPEKYIGDGSSVPAVLKMALCRMRQHIASGDVLTTEQPEAAEMLLSLARRHRRETVYQMPAWMLDAPAAPAAEPVTVATPAAPVEASTVVLHIPAPARVGTESRGLGLYWHGGRVCQIGATGGRPVTRPGLTAYAAALLARA